MKIAIISDIHSNNVSLDLAIEDALQNNVDKFIFLGDYITDGENGNKVLEVVKKYADYAVSGNRERYIINYKKKFDDSYNYKPLNYVFNNTSEKSMEYIKTLPEEKIVEINGYKILMFHGDAHIFEKYGLKMSFDKIIEKYDFDICIFGHIHKFLDIEYKGHHFVDPGSIGQPVDYPTYKYCIMELSDEIEVELREFEVAKTYGKLRDEYENSNFYKENPIWSELIIEGIKDGKDYVERFIKPINEKVKNENILDNHAHMKFWEDEYNFFLENYNGIDFKKIDYLFRVNKIKGVKKLFKFIKNNIQYGWVDNVNKKHYEVNNSDKYILQSPIEVIENKIGICWDLTELYRSYFQRIITEFETYLIYYYINDNCCPSHSILVYYKKNKVCWFEPLFSNEKNDYSGIHEYDSIDELLIDVKNKFIENGIIKGFLPKEINEEKISCYKYSEPKYHLNDNEFFEHCRKGKKINI